MGKLYILNKSINCTVQTSGVLFSLFKAATKCLATPFQWQWPHHVIPINGLTVRVEHFELVTAKRTHSNLGAAKEKFFALG